MNKNSKYLIFKYFIRNSVRLFNVGYFSFFLSFFFMYLPSPNVGLIPPGLITQMPMGQMPIGGAIVYGS